MGMLRDHPRGMFGLEMVRASVGLFKRGSIYVLLGRMEDKGYVRQMIDKQAKHPGLPRPLYTLTALGQRTLTATEATFAAALGWKLVRT